MRPIWLVASSVNQRLPSDPAVMSAGKLLLVGSGYSVILPLGVMRPIWLAWNYVNQRLPSGPAVMPIGSLLLAGTGYSVIVPRVAMRQSIIPPTFCRANAQQLPYRSAPL